MSETMPTQQEAYKMAYEDAAAIAKVTTSIASRLHEDWRKTRLTEDGSYSPRLKPTADKEWSSTHNGQTTVDIANTDFKDLPKEWKAENIAAGEVVATEIVILGRNQVDITPAVVEDIASKVHDKWLERNEWAHGGELDVPYDELSEKEKAKDRDQVMIGLAIYSGKLDDDRSKAEVLKAGDYWDDGETTPGAQ